MLAGDCDGDLTWAFPRGSVQIGFDVEDGQELCINSDDNVAFAVDVGSERDSEGCITGQDGEVVVTASNTRGGFRDRIRWQQRKFSRKIHTPDMPFGGPV